MHSKLFDIHMEETMEDKKFIATMESIVSSIEKTGMNPYAQLYGYLIEGKMNT